MPNRILQCALLLAMAALSALNPAPAAGDSLGDAGFGKKSGGLRMLVLSPPTPAGGSPLLHTIEVEIRAVDGRPVALSEAFSSKLTWLTEAGLALPTSIRTFPTRSPLGDEGNVLKPGKPLTWSLRLLRMSAEAPKKLKLRARLLLEGSPPLESALVEVDLSRCPVPKTLEKAHVAAGWTSGMVFAYQLFQGLHGWRMLEVYPNGMARVFRSKARGGLSKAEAASDLPIGSYTAQLTSAEQAALAASFLKQEAWTLDELPKRMLIPDESSATFTLAADAAIMFARYPIAEAMKASKSYASFQQELDALMKRLVKRARKGKR